MKFELTETVAIANPEEVLRVLEQHLRAVAGDVVRSEGQITAYGIGPSPRTVNRRDTTVIDAHGLDGATVLSVQVNYQASALLGNMPQDGIVRSKIEGAIDEMRGELKVWKPWTPPPVLDAAEVNEPVAEVAPEVEPAGTLQEERKFETGGEQWPAAQTEPSLPTPEVVVSPVSFVPAEKIVESEAETPADRADGPQTPSVAPDVPPAGPYSQALQREQDLVSTTSELSPASKPIDGKTEAERPSAVLTIPADASAQRRAIVLSKGRRKKARLQANVAPQKEEIASSQTAVKAEIVAPVVEAMPIAAREVPLSGLLRGQEAGQVEEEETSLWKTVIAVVIILLLVLGGLGYLLRDQLPLPETWRTTAAEWSSKLVAEAAILRTKVGGEKAISPAPVAPVVAPPVPDATVSDPEVMVKDESNLYLWVQDWAASLRSKDPVAQASYYADTVDRYLTDTAVSRDFVLQDKRAKILQREALWSVKVEHIYVESQNSGGARVRVVERVLARNESGATTEHAVKVRLKLVRVGETWKIVEEQETGPAV